jgi:hypothetical protein
LYAALTKLKVQKAYWLSTIYSDNKKKTTLRKRLKEKYRLHRVVVRLGFTGRKLDDWERRRSQYRKKMAFGKGHK